MKKQTHSTHIAANGSKWIRPEKRLAIYLRDGLACVWCGYGVEDGERFQLDHLTPHSCGGSNDETNLVTSCARCNCSRQDRALEDFAASAADFHGVEDAASILSRINHLRQQPLDRAEAKRIIARRKAS